MLARLGLPGHFIYRHVLLLSPSRNFNLKPQLIDAFGRAALPPNAYYSPAATYPDRRLHR